MNVGSLMCTLGLHKVVTTREGKTSVPQSTSARSAPRVIGAAAHIHCFCAREDCTYHVIIDTHSNTKILTDRDRA